MYLSSVSSKLLLFDTNCWDLKKSYSCYDGILRDISWSDDSKYMLQVNSKGIIEILSAAEHDVRSLQHIPIKDTWTACFHREGHRNVAIGTRNGNVMIWDTKNKTITKSFSNSSQQCSIDFISFNAKNTSLAATMHNGDTVIYGLVSNIPVMTVKLSNSHSISAMKFHHESRSILGMATDEGHVVLRDVTTNKDKVHFDNVHASPVSDIAYSLVNRDVMLSCGYDKVTHVYDVRLQNVVSTLRTPYTLTSMAINYENQVALGAKNGVVLIYDLRDLTNPYKVLQGHEEEVHRLAFQPSRKRILSADLSLREETEIHSPLRVTPVKTRNSDLYYITDSPPKHTIHTHSPQPQETDDKADSFLAMMGLDNSNAGDDSNRNSEDQQSVKHEARYRQLDAEKNNSKISTPLSTRNTDKLAFTSPMTNGIGDENHCPNIHVSMKPSQLPMGDTVMDTKAAEEMKDFIKLTLADVADDNRNYFLHIMMAMTKQKLFLEKQLSQLSGQVHNLIDSQSALIETNRKLSFEIDQLKARQNYL